MSQEMKERGLELFNRLHGGHLGEAMVAEMAGLCPAFADMTIEWAFGGVMSRPGLDLRTRQLILVASCVTLGTAEPQLHAHAQAALAAGATATEIVETILQLTFYAGGPAVRNSLVALKDLLQETPARAAVIPT
jgi:4-carboxymuconolactone decarboxylase